jgi:hypothetical protein
VPRPRLMVYLNNVGQQGGNASAVVSGNVHCRGFPHGPGVLWGTRSPDPPASKKSPTKSIASAHCRGDVSGDPPPPHKQQAPHKNKLRQVPRGMFWGTHPPRPVSASNRPTKIASACCRRVLFEDPPSSALATKRPPTMSPR